MPGQSWQLFIIFYFDKNVKDPNPLALRAAPFAKGGIFSLPF
jgi:hypothetical protein